jgi:PAS domain S-box-containing protein
VAYLRGVPSGPEVPSACPGGRPLVAVGDEQFPPFIWSENGVPRGFVVDFVRDAGKALGCQVDFRLTGWDKAMELIASGEGDILVGITDLDERHRVYAFTERMLTLQARLFSRRDDFDVTDPDALLAGTVVGVQKADVVEAFLRSHHPGLSLREYPDQAAGLRGLAAGEVRAFAGDYYTGRWILQRLGLSEQLKVVGRPFMDGAYALAVRRGNPLLSALNDAVAQTRNSGAAARLQDRWFGEGFFDSRPSSRKVALVVGGLGAVLLVLGLWSLTLRGAVKRATFKLQASERRLEETLEVVRESEERFRVLVDQAPDAIAAEVEGRVAYANPAAAALLGADSAERLMGLRVAEHVHPVEGVGARAVNDPPAAGEARVLRLDGTSALVELRSASVRLGGRPARLTTLRDVTARRQLEDQLRQALKMEAVGRLAGGVAHDFNNLLTVILGACEGLQGLGDTQASDVEAIREAANRAASLTRQLLAFGRRSTLQPKEVELNQVVKDTARLLQRLIGEHFSLNVHCALDTGAVRADPDQLAQVLLNIALNARDAMPAGGEIVVETRRIRLDAGLAWDKSEVRPGEYAELAVIDQGVGMDEATLKHLFEPFFTTKEAGRGTGLGLSVVYGIVTQSGGHVEVVSAPGRGTTVRVHLPATGAAPRTLVEVARDGPAPRGTEVVLVVEDASDVARFVKRTLDELGYRVLLATGPDDAFRLAEAAEDLDLLLTDLVLPGMTGADLARTILRRRPGLRVLYMSGYAADALPRGGELLKKPFTPGQLAHRVRAILGVS